MNESVGSPMRCGEHVRGGDLEAGARGVGRQAEGEITTRGWRRGQREYWRLANDGGAVGAGVGSLSAMGVEEVAVECAANLESLRKCSRAAACIVTPVLGRLVDGFVEGKNFGGLLRP